MDLVITGQRADGTSVIVSDETVLPVVATAFPHFANTALAAADAPPTLPTDGTAPAHVGFFPPPGGYRFFRFTIEPEDPEHPAHTPSATEMEDAERLFPGLFSIYDEEGMERTDSVDLGYVAAGEVLLELDGGLTRTLRAGDAFVQNGTRHRWRNVGPEQVTMVVAILGTRRAPSVTG